MEWWCAQTQQAMMKKRLFFVRALPFLIFPCSPLGYTCSLNRGALGNVISHNESANTIIGQWLSRLLVHAMTMMPNKTLGKSSHINSPKSHTSCACDLINEKDVGNNALLFGKLKQRRTFFLFLFLASRWLALHPTSTTTKVMMNRVAKET